MQEDPHQTPPLNLRPYSLQDEELNKLSFIMKVLVCGNYLYHLRTDLDIFQGNYEVMDAKVKGGLFSKDRVPAHGKAG